MKSARIAICVANLLLVSVLFANDATFAQIATLLDPHKTQTVPTATAVPNLSPKPSEAPLTTLAVITPAPLIVPAPLA